MLTNLFWFHDTFFNQVTTYWFVFNKSFNMLLETSLNFGLIFYFYFMRGFLDIGLFYLVAWKSVGRHDYKIHFFFVQVVTKPAFLHNFFVPSFSPLCVAAANDTSSFQPKWQKMTQTLVREFISLGGSHVSVFETSFIESDAKFTLACSKKWS